MDSKSMAFTGTVATDQQLVSKVSALVSLTA